MTMTMKKVFVTGLGAAAILALTTGNAQAALLHFQLDATFKSGGALTGTFQYDTVGSVYSNWNFVSSPTALTGAAFAPFTNSFIYNIANSVTGADTLSFSNTNTDTFAQFERYEDPQARVLTLVTAASLNSLTTIGSSTTLQINNLNPSAKSYEFYTNVNESNQQNMGLFGGTITSVAVPEPLTILGAATAVGFGAAFKRRALKNNKKA